MAAGSLCFCLVLVGVIAEAIVKFLFKQNVGMLNSGPFMPLLGVIPMAMPAVLHLVLAVGSQRLSKLGIASRGTFALEDLASMDAILFNMTGTLTCNKPCFDKDKVEVYAEGIDKDHAILLAMRASKSNNELFIEPTDAAILGLVDDPEQARVGIEVIEHNSRFFVAMTLMYMTTYIDETGSKCSVLKGDPTQLEIIGLLPFTHELRSNSAEMVDNLIHMGSSVIVLTESPMAYTKHVCGRLGNLGSSVLPADSMRVLVRNKSDLFSNINGISGLFTEHNPHVISNLRSTYGHRCAMVGYEFLDGESIRQSNIGISAANATDSTKSESDLVLTEHALLSISSAVQISREICAVMKSCLVYVVSSTLHVFAVQLMLFLWRIDLSCFQALLIAACNYCTSSAMLFDRVKLSMSPDNWKAKRIIATGAAFGCYITLSTFVFSIIAMRTDFITYIFKARSLSGHDKEIKSVLFLQMSIVNHAIGLFTQLYDGHLTTPGPIVASSFVISQLVITIVAVYGGMNLALTKGIGWGWLIWLYNSVLLLALVFICDLKFNLPEQE
ncbi:hypothetical protein QOZ80_8BG0665080 [Eleusine coracana subsp. coracana]|nr:hypothetical protein QOZ80_8BG0665080 [Eleusine coracana subsp. coracana]